LSLNKSSSRRALGLVLLTIFCVVAAQAADPAPAGAPDPSKFSLTLEGGYGLSEAHQGLLDLKTELQFAFSPRVRIGLGVGYLAGDRHSWFGPDRRFQPGLMMLPGGRGGDDVRLIPLSVNVYYVLPLGPHWNIFASGGGSLYLAELHDLAGQTSKSALGGQTGLGVEYHFVQGVSLVAETSYRLLDFRRFSRMRPDDTPPPGGLGDLSSFLSQNTHRAGINLRGLSLRAGIKINL